MVEVTDLHMHFGAVRALTGVSFIAPDGVTTVLLGENGDGKTTTLNIVSGLHEPMRGTVVRRWDRIACRSTHAQLLAG
jgi:ABC-type branched-subunit amino acid transport system ATPase component